MNTPNGRYGDLAAQLLGETRRATAPREMLQYNSELVQSIIREQTLLESVILDALAKMDLHAMAVDDAVLVSPEVVIYQTIILRNKRCLLAYHHHRLERLKDIYWAVGGALPLLLATAAEPTAASTTPPHPDIRSKLSPHEVDFLRAYNTSVQALQSKEHAYGDIDLFAPISTPPKHLNMHVEVVRECGMIQTEIGALDLKKGQRMWVRRADVEYLITQGFLAEV